MDMKMRVRKPADACCMGNQFELMIDEIIYPAGAAVKFDRVCMRAPCATLRAPKVESLRVSKYETTISVAMDFLRGFAVFITCWNRFDREGAQLCISHP